MFGLAAAASVGLLLHRGSARFGVPDVLAFLLAGLIAGLVGWRPFSASSSLGQAITILAASYILYQGGEGLHLSVVRSVWPTVVLLATLGVLVTMIVIGLIAVVVLRQPLLIGLLVGAVVAATDPAVLIPVYRSVRVMPRISDVVICEAALNDATGAICTTVVAGIIVTGNFSVATATLAFGSMVALGLLIGALIGVLNVLLVAAPGGPLAGLAGVLMVPASVLAYLTANSLGGSGLMAAFTAGVVLGNHGPLPIAVADSTREMSRQFAQPMSIVLRALLFIGLGSNLDWPSLEGHWLGAALVVIALIFIARPLAVLLSTAPDRVARWRWRELVLLGWARETGVVPGALATLLLANHVRGAQLVAGVTVAAIVGTVILQAPTTGPLARWLGLAGSLPPTGDLPLETP